MIRPCGYISGISARVVASNLACGQSAMRPVLWLVTGACSVALRDDPAALVLWGEARCSSLSPMHARSMLACAPLLVREYMELLVVR